MLRRTAVMAAAALLGSLLLTACLESPPQIISLNPPRGSVGVQADVPVVVQFDRPVVPSTLAGRVSVSPEIAGCDLTRAFTAPLTTSCRAVWLSDNTAFVIEHPRAIFAPVRQYTFTVLGGFRSPDGTVNSVDHSWQLSTGSAPEVRGLSPPDGSRNVPVDAPVAISFSGGMEDTTTSKAIRLDPPVPGTRVVRSLLDKSRFAVFPGHLLQPDTKYRLSVSRNATDIHHQPVLAPAVSTFTTGAISGGGHALVLAAKIGEQPTQVLIASLAPLEPGVPVAAPVVLEAPRCSVTSGCGDAPDGEPLYTFVAAQLSPGARWLVVVERDATAIGATPTLLVLDAARGTVVESFADSSLPGWSPDGATLAFANGRHVALFTPATGELRALPAGDPLLATPVWDARGELLAMAVGPDPAHAHVDLGDAAVQARYAAPRLDGFAADPVLSPDGSQLAVNRLGPVSTGAWIIGLGSSGFAPRELDPALTPVGYSADGTLMATVAGASGPRSLVLVNVDSGDRIALAHPPPAAALPTIDLSAPLRRFAFIAPGPQGADEAFIENADGSASFPITSFGKSGFSAAAVTLNG